MLPPGTKGAVTHNATRRHELAHHRQGGPVCPGGGPVEASKVPRPARGRPVIDALRRLHDDLGGLLAELDRWQSVVAAWEGHPATLDQAGPKSTQPRTAAPAPAAPGVPPPATAAPPGELPSPHQEALETQRRRRASEASGRPPMSPEERRARSTASQRRHRARVRAEKLSSMPPANARAGGAARPARGADGCGIAGADRAVAVWRQRRRSLAAGLGARGALGGRCAEGRQDQRGGKDNGANSQHGRLPEVIAR